MVLVAFTFGISRFSIFELVLLYACFSGFVCFSHSLFSAPLVVVFQFTLYKEQPQGHHMNDTVSFWEHL